MEDAGDYFVNMWDGSIFRGGAASEPRREQAARLEPACQRTNGSISDEEPEARTIPSRTALLLPFRRQHDLRPGPELHGGEGFPRRTRLSGLAGQQFGVIVSTITFGTFGAAAH